jgi:hypothetical protein
MSRPIGASILAILSFLQGLYQIYVVLIYLGATSFNIVGNAVSFPNPQWGQATLAGIMALIYFWVAYGFWTLRVWAWLYGVLITGFNLIWYSLAVIGPTVTMEMALVPIVINLLIFGYLYNPGTRAVFAESEGARMDAIMDAREGGNAPPPRPAPVAAAPAPAPAAPAAPPAPPPDAGSTSS